MGTQKDKNRWLKDWRRFARALETAGYSSGERSKQLGYDLAEIVDACRRLPAIIDRLTSLLRAESEDRIALLEVLHDLSGEFWGHLPAHLRSANKEIARITHRVYRQLEQSGMDEVAVSRALDRHRRHLRKESSANSRGDGRGS
jgi:hypothetical protein